jgi:hypothetical protein
MAPAHRARRGDHRPRPDRARRGIGRRPPRLSGRAGRRQLSDHGREVGHQPGHGRAVRGALRPHRGDGGRPRGDGLPRPPRSARRVAEPAPGHGLALRRPRRAVLRPRAYPRLAPAGGRRPGLLPGHARVRLQPRRHRAGVPRGGPGLAGRDHGLRQGAPGLRQAARDLRGHLVPDRRDGDAHRRLPRTLLSRDVARRPRACPTARNRR